VQREFNGPGPFHSARMRLRFRGDGRAINRGLRLPSEDPSVVGPQQLLAPLQEASVDAARAGQLFEGVTVTTHLAVTLIRAEPEQRSADQRSSLLDRAATRMRP
jgi:hypothetical protein